MSHSANAQSLTTNRREPPITAQVIEALSEAVGRLRYGVVQLTVHDGRVVQLDVTERQRFTS